MNLPQIRAETAKRPRSRELVELIRLAAARQGRSERRFDAAHPELNLQLADGSRLFAVERGLAVPAVTGAAGYEWQQQAGGGE